MRGTQLYDASGDAANIATAIAVLLDLLAVWRQLRVPQAPKAKAVGVSHVMPAPQEERDS